MGKAKSKDSKDGMLAYWQSTCFHLLGRDGKDREAGMKRPDGIPFVKGGRARAIEEAQRLWSEFKGLKPEAKAAGDVDSEQGEKPWEGEPLESEERPVISDKPARISVPRGTISGRRDVRITAPTMGRRGLDS